MSKNSKSQRRPIITDITIKAPTRRPWDVGDWRSALSAADRGRTKQLYDLYEDMLLDPVLSNAIDKRRDAVTNADLTFLSRDGEEVDEVIDLMESEGFETLLSQIIAGRLIGRSATELSLDEDGLRAAVIPPQHIDLEHRAILPDPTSDEGAIPYDGLGSLVVLGEARHYGVILRAIPYAVYKRGGYGDWAQWVELFGMPQRIGKYSTFDPQTRVQLQEALERMGSAPYLIVPKEADIEVKETKATSGISFDQFRQACNEEILIGILGQTLTTTAGERGARSLGEVHREVEAAKYKSDMRYVRRTLNRLLLPFLERRGIATEGGSFVVPEDPEPVTVDELATLSHIIAIPADYIRDKYGIPTPSEGDELAGTPQVPTAPEPPQEEEPEETEETPEKPEPPEEEEKKEKKSLGSRLSRFFGSAPHPVTEGEGLTGRLRRWTDSIRGRITLSDDYSIDLRELLEEAVRRVYGGESDLALRLLFSASDLPLQEAVAEGFTVSPSFGERNPDFDAQFRYNTAVFAAFKGHAEWESISRELTDEEGRLRSFAAFRRAVRPIIGRYNDQWLRTEYNTVVRSARSAAKWQDALRSREALPNLEYLLSGAVDKREEHREWVGTVLPILHPWWDTHLPPSEWNCKCSFRPTDKPVTGVPDDGDHPVEPTFAQNPGRTASPLKLSEHPYLRGKGDPSCPECRRQGLVPGERSIQNAYIDRGSQYCIAHRFVYLEGFRRFVKEALRKRMYEGRHLQGEVIMGRLDNSILKDLRSRGIALPRTDAVTDASIIYKYIDHPKASKGATVPVEDIDYVTKALLDPQKVYRQIDKRPGETCYVMTTPYKKGKVVKVVVHINYRRKTRTFNFAKSWGVTDEFGLGNGRLKRIK